MLSETMHIDFKYKEEKGLWSNARVIAKDYQEAVEKAWKVLDAGKDTSDFSITRIEQEEAELDAI